MIFYSPIVRMEAFSLKQRLIMTGMKSNSLPKIAIGGNSSPAHSENMENTVYVTFSQPASAKGECSESYQTFRLLIWLV